MENNLKSIAFSALSTGVYGYPSNEAAETALGVVRKFLEGSDGEKLDRVVFCNFTEKDVKAYENLTPLVNYRFHCFLTILKSKPR